LSCFAYIKTTHLVVLRTLSELAPKFKDEIVVSFTGYEKEMTIGARLGRANVGHLGR